jgi:hypothetical protein
MIGQRIALILIAGLLGKGNMRLCGGLPQKGVVVYDNEKPTSSRGQEKGRVSMKPS